MPKTCMLTERLNNLIDFCPFNEDEDLIWELAMIFAAYEESNPDDYVEEFEAICEHRAIDGEELRNRVTASQEVVDWPRGAYERVETRALECPKNIPGIDGVRDKKKHHAANIIYYLAQGRKPNWFNIPVPLVKKSARYLSEKSVYNVIDDLIKNGFIVLRDPTWIPGKKGKLYEWVKSLD